jgi:hypothetical protein
MSRRRADPVIAVNLGYARVRRRRVPAKLLAVFVPICLLAWAVLAIRWTSTACVCLKCGMIVEYKECHVLGRAVFRVEARVLSRKRIVHNRRVESQSPGCQHSFRSYPDSPSVDRIAQWIWLSEGCRLTQMAQVRLLQKIDEIRDLLVER